MTKELIINACLAGFWAGLAVFTASNQPLTRAALAAALAVAIRAAVGYVAAKNNKTIPVDQ
jgi:hypothetical protein